MQENPHIPPRLWSAYGSGAINNTESYYVPGKVGGIPSPHAQMVYFQLQPYNVGQAGQLTLLLPTAGNAPGVNTSYGVMSPVKSWWIPAGATPAQLFEYSPPIPVGFDTSGANTFLLYNGLPIPNFPNAAACSFVYWMSVLPLH